MHAHAAAGKKKLYKEEAAWRNAPGRLKMKCREE